MLNRTRRIATGVIVTLVAALLVSPGTASAELSYDIVDSADVAAALPSDWLGATGFSPVVGIDPVGATAAAADAAVAVPDVAGAHTRTILDTASGDLVGDMFKTETSLTWVGTLVQPTATGPVLTEVARVTSQYDSARNMVVADSTFAGGAGGHVETPAAAAAGPCYQLDCLLVGTAAGAVGVPACGVVAFVVSLAPAPGAGVISSMICAAVFLAFGVGASAYCDARGESTTCLQPIAGVLPQDIDCGVDRCIVDAQVAPRGRSITHKTLRIGWEGRLARYNSECGCYMVESYQYYDLYGPYNSLYPQAVEYSAYAVGTPYSFVACTDRADIYIGFNFSDGTFSSQFIDNWAKPSNIGFDPSCIQ